MRQAAINIKHYSKTRDQMWRPTSHLSAYIKYGCVSIREVYKTFRSNHEFIRQLYWRDFYANIVYAFPHVLGHPLKKNYNGIRWTNSERLFNAWKTGTTGIPILDAAQRQLLTEGWCHNRGRMISSSMLTKIFLIDWRKGEQFYAQHLVDYDVANNSGGWQWSSSVGADAQPYFRYFNPYLQSKEHDPDCEYIKKYVPELKDVPPKDIHNWETEWVNYKDTKYMKPIVDYAEAKEQSMKMFRGVFK
jgi:deoxyribodipyrimidine photo-lyase